jgi:5'(3')-deoxyribonucleotidase
MADLTRFVLGLDLDGTCADFYGRMREIAAEWTGRPIEELNADPDWGLKSWGLVEGEYERLHRFAVTQRELFESMKPIAGAPQALRRLGTEGVRIRVITHRLFIRHFHETAVAQTVRWLDHHGIPYWDLCFMRRKGEVGADLYMEDSPENVEDLRAAGKHVVILSNAANAAVSDEPGGRARDWTEAERMIRDRYYPWLDEQGLERPPGIGLEPAWSEAAPDTPVL